MWRRVKAREGEGGRLDAEGAAAVVSRAAEPGWQSSQ
jgi:hypothetical protein